MVWQYTALLEKICERDTELTECPVQPDLLRQALYNTRQHEAFLTLVLADIIQSAKEVTRLQSDLKTRMELLKMQSGEKLLVKTISKSDASVQTETHPLETNIVKSYEWNEWELRRKAIKLANLRNKVTRSMQTDCSHMRRHNSTQTFLLKDAAGQTKRNGESNVPKPQVYLSGLRGAADTAAGVMKVDLTRAVDE